MAITEKQKHEMKKFLKEMETYKGRHTELVTVYIPKDYDLNKIIHHLAEEQGTATNIKSTSTRNNVTASLEKMIQHLRLFKKTPENGLAVFSGNVAKREGQQDFQVWSMEPPVPLNTRIYRCDKTFQLDILRDLTEVKETYGLIVLDRRDANIALLKGKTIIPILQTHSQVPGKFKAGGQSAARFARLREGAIKDHYKKVGEYVKEKFLFMKELKGIIVGGPGPTKYDFVDGNFITNDLKKKIIAVRDLSYTGEFGLQELLEKSEDVLADEDVAGEKKIMSKFFETLAKKPGMASYGEAEVLENLKNGVVDIVLLSEVLDDEMIEKFETEAKKTGAEVKLISIETREGSQLKDFGKIAAILRYEIK
jgi:peptide chain release factor subunit 1